jgi:hypothetical protein
MKKIATWGAWDNISYVQFIEYLQYITCVNSLICILTPPWVVVMISTALHCL